MHSRCVSRANSPKGGDAKPPVYGTRVPTTAGLPARTLNHLPVADYAREQGCSMLHTPSVACTPASTTGGPRLQRYLDNALHKSLSAAQGAAGQGTCAA